MEDLNFNCFLGVGNGLWYWGYPGPMLCSVRTRYWGHNMELELTLLRSDMGLQLMLAGKGR